ncbi:MAG: NAD-dependent epimerase/dehydratase family protein [Candidatus Woesearchaeota archaeon]
MRCLITGGAGFIGSNLAKYLEEKKNYVVIIDNFSTGHKNNIKNFKGKIIEYDISKKPDLKEKFDVIFHLAAITDPRYPNDEELLKQNLDGFEWVLKKAKKDRSKLIYASSASLYGNTKAPQEEDQPKEILSAYAKSKLIMDEMASHHFSDMHIIGLRYFNVFGPGEEYKGRAASMIYHLTKMMKRGENPKIFKWGEQKRDHIYVKDCVLANIKALEAKSGIYNVGTGISTSFNELVSLINSALGTDLKPIYIDLPYEKKTYQANTQADTKRAKKFLRFQAKYKLIDAIKEYVKMI